MGWRARDPEAFRARCAAAARERAERRPDREPVLDLWAKGGLSAKQVGDQLGLTANVVVGIVFRARKMGDPRAVERGTPIRRGPPATPKPKQRRTDGAKAVRPSDGEQKRRADLAAQTKRMAAPRAIEGRADTVLPARLAEIPRTSHRECQAVSGDPRETGRWHYCGKPTARGAYCAEHAARFYRTPSEAAA